MRERDLVKDRNELTDTAVIRRMRDHHRLTLSPGDMIQFDAAGFHRDRLSGIAEHAAVENNIRIRPAWPEIVFD